MTGTLFDGDELDHVASRALADEGAHRADEHANPNWKHQADDVMHWCASTYDRFTSDQFWRRCADLQIPSPRERRAFAGVVARARREGWIAITNDTRNSDRKQAHANPKRVYRSLLRGVGQSPSCPHCGGTGRL